RVRGDSVLRALHGDPRWPPLVADADARHAALDSVLRRELLGLAERDQANRQGIMELVGRFGRGSPQVDSAEAAMAAADAPLQARLREIVRTRGWPGRRLVGDDGAHAAWLVVQHMDAAYQREVLPLLLDAAARGDARPGDAAYLEDRVRMADGRPQRYGTQLRLPEAGGGAPVLHPVEDEPCVDRRRAEARLGPLADYLRELGVAYTPPSEACR
ncbi:MAG TPA: DUF6624 domain-containing protein, partial [Longimicrobiaceae bacterium]|nr:DUF6624 domain-containing protein [Longimicrobiaceae bacterium]